ncbi:AraC family transcriptional regulator [Paenibacillaceae bacterium]|nr:AraC family transcriptional regulator [Paenibacillaceae bacterium]
MESCKEIIAERRTYTSSQVTHSHIHAQIIIPLQGELAIKAGAQELLIDHQRLFFVPSGCEHSFHSAARNEFLVVDIPHFMVSSSELPSRGVSYSLNNQWKGIRYLILNEMEQSSLDNSALRGLFPYIAHHLFQQQQPDSIRYIHENYHMPIAVQQLAALEHYHRSYYSTWFLKETGKTPSAYIQEVRLNHAKQLLRNTQLPILHIAIQVGLEHQSTLTRLFQKHEGITPSEYRRQHLAKII